MKLFSMHSLHYDISILILFAWISAVLLQTIRLLGEITMEQQQLQILSAYDALPLDTLILTPEGPAKGIVQFSHGMAEHKERYLDFMKYLTEQGYVTVIHDHRGHGASVKDKGDLGYFYTEDIHAIVSDLYDVTRYVRTLYPTLPVYLFSHSMGTLVARNYMKLHDDEIAKVILCGPPTENKAVDMGIGLAKAFLRLGQAKKRNLLLHAMSVGSYSKPGESPIAWLSVNRENRDRYAVDPLCGYVFTTNGFWNLFNLQKSAFDSTDWPCHNSDLPILVMAGDRDPVIQNKEKFRDMVTFLYTVGYRNIHQKLYSGMKHEVLNETGKEGVYRDVLAFLEA